MSDLFDIIHTSGTAAENPYSKIGFTRNPFRAPDPGEAPPPLYSGHIEAELQQIRQWLKSVHVDNVRQPLSLVGTIGSGKTALLAAVERSIRAWPADQRAEVFRFNLPDIGMSRPNLGALLISAIERMGVPAVSVAPDQSLRVVWGIVQSSEPLDGSGRLTPVFNRIRGASGEEKAELARLLSRWLERSPLTPAQANRLGLHRRIDWEGEVVAVAGELLRMAARCRVIKTVFLLVDQLEDLFTSNVTALRRARILTDLRGLIDEIDAGAPIGLVLSWSPDVRAGVKPEGEVEAQLQRQYEALFSRMERVRVNIPFLSRDRAAPFAEEWLKPARAESGADPTKQPDARALAEAAWSSLRSENALFPGDKITPREFLTHLSREVDRRAGIRK